MWMTRFEQHSMSVTGESPEGRTIFSMDFPENIMRPRRDLISFIFASGAACTMVSITVSCGSSASDYSKRGHSKQAGSGLDTVEETEARKLRLLA